MVYMSTNTNYNFHDIAAKRIFGIKENFTELLTEFMPPNILQELEKDTIHFMKDNLIDPNSREKLIDILASIELKIKEKDSKKYTIINFEHKSQPDKYLDLQLLGYKTAIQWRQKQKNEYLHPIFFIIFYNGKAKWNYRFLKHEEEWEDVNYKGSYVFINVRQIVIDKLQSKELRKIFFVFKHIWDFKKYLEEGDDVKLHKLVEQLVQYFQLSGNLKKALQNNEILLMYILRFIPIHYRSKMRQLLSKHIEVGGMLMQTKSLRELLMEEEREYGMQKGMERGRQEGMERGIEKGREEGIEKGRLEMARRLREEGVSIHIIEKTTNLSKSDIEKL